MLKILIVEDDKELNSTVCSFLNRNGYEAIGCLYANEAYDENLESINRDVVTGNLSKLNIFGFEHKEYVKFMNGMESYYDANMDLLNGEVRHQLLNKKRPIFTKTRDDMPTRYGTKSQVKNSLIADGCVIDGIVKNSIIFWGV